MSDAAAGTGPAMPLPAPSLPAPSPPTPLERARGGIAIAVGTRDGVAALRRLRQDGCLKARFPRPVNLGFLSATTLNTSGGVAAGDVLDIRVAVEDGARLTVASQAAERFYRARPGEAPARVRTALSVAAGGTLEWLPQDSIVFDRASLDRALAVELAPDATFIGVERVVFGRAAMDEEVRHAVFRDLLAIRRDGVPVLHDAVRFDGAVASLLDRRAVGGGARAMATMVMVAPDAPARLGALRAALDASPVEAGASARDGMLLARMVSPDGAALRDAVEAGLAALRDGRMLPREWLC